VIAGSVFKGACLLIVRTTRNEGIIHINAKSKGLKTADLILTTLSDKNDLPMR